MSIIYTQGNDFWIETLLIQITLTDAAGAITTTNTPLERAGTCIGYMSTMGFFPANDNTENLGGISVLDQGSGTIFLGEAITGIVIRAQKAVGTAGNTVGNVIVTLMMKTTGSGQP